LSLTSARLFCRSDAQSGLEDQKTVSALVSAQLAGLDQYMSEVRRFSLISREEEAALARQLRDEGDVEAAHKLVTSNLRFVVKVAMEYRSYGTRMLDLVQEGNVGLMHAVRKFDPERGYRLITYAVWWIRAYIQSYLLKAFSLVKIGTTQAQRRIFFKLGAARKELEHELGTDVRELSDEERHRELARAIGVKERDIGPMEMRMSARDFSLDLALEEGGDATHMDVLADDSDNSESLVGAAELAESMRTDLREAMKTLNAREREVIELRHLREDPPTLREVGKGWGVSRERARQIEAAAKKKLQAHLLQNSRALREALPGVADETVAAAPA
jgi:RNA polymerase sigma-32 factor